MEVEDGGCACSMRTLRLEEEETLLTSMATHGACLTMHRSGQKSGGLLRTMRTESGTGRRELPATQPLQHSDRGYAVLALQATRYC